MLLQLFAAAIPVFQDGFVYGFGGGTWLQRNHLEVKEVGRRRVTYSNDLLHIDSLRLIRCIQISSNLKGGPITTCIGCIGIRCIGYGCSDMNGEGALQADLQIACLDNASFR